MNQTSQPLAGGAMGGGFADFVEAWRRRQIAIYFAWTETLARYRRSVLGPIWLVVSTFIGVVGIGVIWGSLLKADASEFVPVLAIGLVTWQMISGSVTEATSVFARAAGSILNVKAPTFLFSLQLLLRQLINFAHNLVIVIAIVVFFPSHLGPLALLAIPGFAIVAASLLGMIQVLGFVGARYRDIEPLIGSFMPILFFVTPVIYQSRQLGAAQPLMELNPFAHWIRLIRDPVMGEVPGIDSYVAAIAILLVIWTLALWLTGSRSHRLPYWI